MSVRVTLVLPYHSEINNLLNCIYGVIDEAYDVLNDMKNKDSLKTPHGNGLCEPKNLLEALKQIAQHLALGTARVTIICVLVYALFFG